MATPAQLPVGRRDRFFYTGMAIVAATILFTGFARTYYLRALFGRPPLRPLLHLHGFLFTCWFVLLLCQVTLVAAKRTDIHRRLGLVGAVLALLMVVVGPIVAIQAARRGVQGQGMPPPLVFLAIPLFDILVFAILVAAGFYFRQQSQTHKRLMLLATIAILPPATARLAFTFVQTTGPLTFFGLADLVLLACFLYDVVTRRRLHPAYLWGGLLILVSQPCACLSGVRAPGSPSPTGSLAEKLRSRCLLPDLASVFFRALSASPRPEFTPSVVEACLGVKPLSSSRRALDTLKLASHSS